MAFRRQRGFKRRRTFRKRPYKGSKRLKTVIHREISKRHEVKSFLLAATESKINTLTVGTFTTNVLTNIAQGVGVNQRIGNKIKLIGMQLKMILNNNTTTPVMVRAAILRMYDRAQPTTTTDFFQGTTGGTVDTADLLGTTATMIRPWSPIFVQSQYMNRVFKLGANTGDTDSAVKTVSKFIKFRRGITCKFNDSSSTVGNITPCIPFCLWGTETQNDLGAGVDVEYTYQIRLFYTDV